MQQLGSLSCSCMITGALSQILTDVTTNCLKKAARTIVHKSNTKASYCSKPRSHRTLIFKIIQTSKLPYREAPSKCKIRTVTKNKTKYVDLTSSPCNHERHMQIIKWCKYLDFHATECGIRPKQALQHYHETPSWLFQLNESSCWNTIASVPRWQSQTVFAQRSQQSDN